MRKTVEAQLLQFTLGIIFELKTPLVSEGGRYVVTSLKPSKKLMKWKPFKRLKEPKIQHSRHVFLQRIHRKFIFVQHCQDAGRSHTPRKVHVGAPTMRGECSTVNAHG